MMKRTIVMSLMVVMAGCGGEKKDGEAKAGAKEQVKAEEKLVVPAIGVDSPKRLNYGYGPGAKEYAKVVAAYKAKPRDWAAVRTAAEATIAKDGEHLEARWALGEALVNTGEGKKGSEQLIVALAADWLRWGPTLAQDAELKAHLETAEGKKLVAASEELGRQVKAAIEKGPLLLGRRSSWKAPKPGTGYAATRGELYAYDVAAKRFVRATHTDHTLAAALPAPSGELLLVGFAQAEVPPAEKAKTVAPVLVKSWVTTWSPTELKETSKRAAIGKARTVTAGWGRGEQLVVITAAGAGRWGAGATTAYVVDRGTGKLTKSKDAAIEGPRVAMSLDDVVDGAGARMPELPAEVKDKLAAAVDVDEGEPIVSSAALSPGGGHVAYASKTDPCKDEDDAAKPSLYVGDAKTGTYKHVLTAASRFGVRWIDDTTLLYEDGSGGLRFYDAAAGRESGKLADRHGLAIGFLPPAAAPLCTTDPPAPVVTDAELEAIDEMMALPPELEGLDESGAEPPEEPAPPQ